MPEGRDRAAERDAVLERELEPGADGDANVARAPQEVGRADRERGRRPAGPGDAAGVAQRRA